MKIKLKTATLIATIATGLYALVQIIFTLQRISYLFYNFETWFSALVHLFFAISVFLFFYSLYQNQKK